MHFQSIKFDRGYAALASVTLAAAAAPIFIRFTQEEGVPSLSIIFLRLLITSLVLAPFVLRTYQKELASLNKKDWGLLLVAGAMHALNLSLLFFSLEYTSVLLNSVLRRTTPLWAIAMEIMMLHAVFSRRVWFGVFLTLFGGVIVGLSSPGTAGSHPLLGSMLALTNAVMNGLYLIIGRHVRQRLSFLSYSWIVFSGAALVTAGILLGTHTPLTGFSTRGYLLIVVVTIIAQFFGHIPINAALHRFSATFVSTALQLSVAVAGLFAFLFLGEIPTFWQIAGGVFILSGITIASQKDIKPALHE